MEDLKGSGHICPSSLPSSGCCLRASTSPEQRGQLLIPDKRLAFGAAREERGMGGLWRVGVCVCVGGGAVFGAGEETGGFWQPGHH